MNFEQIFNELGVVIPEDKKEKFLEKMSENYITIEEYRVCKEEQGKYKKELETKQAEYETSSNSEAIELKEQVETLTRQLEEEKEARASENRRFENKEAVNKFLSGKKFINDITRNSVGERMLNVLTESKDSTAEEAFNAVIAEVGSDNVLQQEKRKVPCFVSLKEPERQKGSDKLKAMSLDERISLRRNNPSQYMDMLNDK